MENDNSLYNDITSVNIPNSVTTIGTDAFDGNNLTTVTIGTGITSIGNTAFTKGVASNSNLSNITIAKTCSVIKNMNYYPWLSESGKHDVTVYGLNNEVCNSW